MVLNFQGGKKVSQMKTSSDIVLLKQKTQFQLVIFTLNNNSCPIEFILPSIVGHIQSAKDHWTFSGPSADLQ